MNQCICSRCKNLKTIIDEDKEEDHELYESCEYGFPSENCLSCDLDACDLTCEHFEEDLAQDEIVIKHCKLCQKELRFLASSGDGDTVYCVDCYLNKSK